MPCCTRIWTILLTACVVAPPAIAQGRAPKPSIRVDLKQFGYLDPGSRPRDQTWDETGYAAFLDADTIVVAFSEFPRRLGAQSAKLVLLHAKDGRLIRGREWQATDGPELIQGPGDKFFMQSARTLTLYSRDLVPLRSREIKDASVAISPSGRTLLTYNRMNCTSACEFVVLDAESLEQRATWTAPDDFYVAVSDDAVVSLREEGHMKWSLLIKEFHQPSRILYTPQGTWCEPKPLFATNSLLVVNQPDMWFGCFEFLVMDREGKVLRREPLEKYEHFDHGRESTVSRDGTHLTVVITQRKVGFWLKLFGETGIAPPKRQRLLVYDLVRGREIWNLVLKPLPKQSPRVALSPDGSQLALLRDGWLEIYSTEPAVPHRPQRKPVANRY
jgi:hypothetical protein